MGRCGAEEPDEAQGEKTADAQEPAVPAVVRGRVLTTPDSDEL